MDFFLSMFLLFLVSAIVGVVTSTGLLALGAPPVVAIIGATIVGFVIGFLWPTN